MPASLLRPHNVFALFALVWLLSAFGLFLRDGAQTAQTLLDTDDAMRLVQMRGWLAGQGWYDLIQPRFDVPFESFWSRLIDVGLAGLLVLLRQFFDAAEAERLMRAIWPLLWIGPMLAGMVATAWRLAGREGAIVALLLAAAGVPAYQQFGPGRIDHHNVQMALAMLTVAAIAWSDRKPWCAAAAGALSGLALAIGFESVPYLAACGAALALRYAFDREASGALVRYGLALAVAASLAFLVSVGQPHWSRSLCDAIAINTVSAVVGAGLVLAFAGWLSHPHAATRVAAVLGAGFLSMAILLLWEPRCLRGPFALVDPALWPIWLSDVREMRPLWSLLQSSPLTATMMVAFPAAALAATLVLARDPKRRRDPAFWTAAAALVAACAVTVAAIRGYSYAIWFGMPLVSAFILQMFTRFSFTTWRARIATAVLLTPLVLSSGVVGIAIAAGFQDREDFSRPESKPCFASANYGTLATLPPGLIVTDVSYGPYILALTPHRILSAPYHWQSRGIVAAWDALAAPPDVARAKLASLKADYVMLCGPRPPAGLADPQRKASLWGQLNARNVPDWLQPVQAGPAFAVYRIKGAR